MNESLGRALWVMAIVWLIVPVLDVVVIDLNRMPSFLAWVIVFAVFIGGSVALWVARGRGMELPLPVKVSALLFHAFFIFILYGNILVSVGLLEVFSGESQYLISAAIIIENIIAAIIAAAIVGIPTVIVAGRWVIAVAFIYWVPVVILSGSEILDLSVSWFSVLQPLAVLLAFVVTLYACRQALANRF